MKSNIRLEDISDGKLYTANDLVKADCHDCEGCSACCSGMASIVLYPLDVWLLCKMCIRDRPISAQISSIRWSDALTEFSTSQMCC